MSKLFNWLYLTFYGVIILLINYFVIQQYSKLSELSFSEELHKLHQYGYLIRTPGCTIPNLNLLDDDIKRFFFEERQIVCNKGAPALVGSNMTSIYIIESSLAHYITNNDTDLLKCCFQPFHRVNPKNNTPDKAVEFDKNCYSFNHSANVSHEFIKVSCSYKEKKIYKDFFGFVPLKNTSKESNNTNQLNVLIVGIDSMSRLNFHRQMPKTANYLSELKSIEMLGYNKVGDNSFPNQMPILTGLSQDQLKKTCLAKKNSYFDKCRFIWEKFRNAGYTTAFGEDNARITLFSYFGIGFLNQPTDYFWSPFDRAAEAEIGNSVRSYIFQCIGSRISHKVLVDYIQKFVKTMITNSKPFFSYFWSTSLSHNFLNKPKLGDVDFYNFLFELNETGALNSTVLIFLSDHGIRFGDFRKTFHGRIEERLPYLYVRLPDWYAREHSELVYNLETNRRRLISAFDLYDTLLDIINSENLTNEFILKRNSDQTVRRGISLFNKISVNRTCDDAGITSDWCTCTNSKKISADDDIVKEAANYVVQHINGLLTDYTECAELELGKILDVRMIINSDDILKAHFIEDYIITLKAEPSGAIFETTVRKFIKFTSPKDYLFNVTGSISRINLYGNQSRCIDNRHLKLYCYCKQIPPKH